MYLSQDEIQRLTGYKRASMQIAWLRQNGYKFAVNGLRQPVVAIAEANRKLVGGSATKVQEPNWDAMHG